MVCPNDLHTSHGIPSKSERNMLNESSLDQKCDAALIDADFPNDSSFSNDILNKFENISEESILDVTSNIIYPHNALVSCGRLIQCKARVPNGLGLDYNSDGFLSTVICPYREVTSNEYCSQCEKYVLNEATLFIICGYEDPTLFRGISGVSPHNRHGCIHFQGPVYSRSYGVYIQYTVGQTRRT